MNCWHCGTELIWGGDHDLDEHEDIEYDILTNLTFHSKAASDFQFTYTDILGNTIEYPIFMSPEMEGTLMLFPSTLHHQVYPFYNTEEPRISISGNLLWNVVEL